MRTYRGLSKAVKEKTTKTVMHCYPGMVALVTAEWEGTPNIMSAGWHSYISIDPPMYGVAIGEERFTHHLVKNAGAYAINFVPAEYAHYIQQAGTLTGSSVDKFQELGIEWEAGETICAPILKAAYVAYECKVVDIKRYGDHDWIVGTIEMFHKDPECFTEKGLPNWDKLNIPLYLGRSQYLVADQKTTTINLHKKSE